MWCLCISIYTHKYMHTMEYTHTHIYIHTMGYTCIYIHTYGIHLYIYIYTHTHTHTHTHIHTHNGISAIKKKQDKFILRHMDGPRDCHSEWSMSDTKRQILYDINYMWILKKKGYKWTYLQNRIRVTDVENNL